MAELPGPGPSAPLEAELRRLGRRLEVPPAPDVTGRVRARLEAPARAGGSGPDWPWLRPVAVTLAVIIAVAGTLAASPDVRAAVADFFRFAGIEINSGAPPPTTGTGRLPGQTGVTLDEARRRAGFDVHVPAALGPPDKVLASDGTSPRVVSLLYRAGPGRPPANQDGVAVRIDEFDGELSPGFRKFAQQAEEVTAGDRPALWLAGPHPVIYVGRDGQEYQESARLAGNTLILQIGSVTVRMEGDFTRDQAIAIAASLG